MFRATLIALLAGCLLGFVVLVFGQHMDGEKVLGIVLLLVWGGGVIIMAKGAWEEHKPWVRRWSIWMSQHAAVLLKGEWFWWRKRGDRKKNITELKSHIAHVGKLISPQEGEGSADLSFLSEFQALVKSLAHFGTPTNSARLRSEDLDFYHEWLSDLEHRFSDFQQQKNVTDALSAIQSFHTTLGTQYAGVYQSPAYRQANEDLQNLTALFNKGGISVESLLPQIQKIQKRLENVFLAEQRRQNNISLL